MNEQSDRYLRGKLLIAMPDMSDPRFRKSVILMLVHTDNDAMGVVVNKIACNISATQIVGAQQSPDVDPIMMPLYDGGPVDPERVMVIHSGNGTEYSSTQIINENFCVTVTPDIFEDLARGHGPKHSMLIHSYAGWAAGQLEYEIANNAWLVCDASPKLVFSTDCHQKWEAAIKSLGINPAMLASSGGNA